MGGSVVEALFLQDRVICWGAQVRVDHSCGARNNPPGLVNGPSGGMVPHCGPESKSLGCLCWEGCEVTNGLPKLGMWLGRTSPDVDTHTQTYL